MATGFPVIKKCFCKGFKGPSLSYADIHTDGVDFNLLATNAEKEIKRITLSLFYLLTQGRCILELIIFSLLCIEPRFKKKTQP